MLLALLAVIPALAALTGCSPHRPTQVVKVAQYNGGQTDFLNGAIDDVRFYGRALSAAEVSALP